MILLIPTASQATSVGHTWKVPCQCLLNEQVNEWLPPSLWEVFPHISSSLSTHSYNSANPWGTFPLCSPSCGYWLLVYFSDMFLKNFVYKGLSASSLCFLHNHQSLSPDLSVSSFLSLTVPCRIAPSKVKSMHSFVHWYLLSVYCTRGRQAEHWRGIYRLPLFRHQKDRH